MSESTNVFRGLKVSGALSRPCLLALACVLAVSTTCGDPEISVIVQEGERIDLIYDDEFLLCGGTVSAFDRWIEFAARQLELDPDSFEHKTYTWLGSEDYKEISPRTAVDADGWAFGSESYATTPDLFHEVTHMVAHEVKVNAITFLAEGLATALGGQAGNPIIVDGRIDPRPYLGSRYRKIEYSIAGSFVGYLLTIYGPGRLWQLNQELRFLSTAGRFRRQFRAVYGAELDDVVDDYLNNETCPEERWKAPLSPACDGQEVPWADEDRWYYARVIDCSDADVVGGLSVGNDRASVALTLRIEHSDLFSVRVLGEPWALGVLSRCGGCPWLDRSYFVGEEKNLVYLKEGVYSLVLHARASDITPVLVAIERRDPSE
ncbi:MAG TPA: hypothetical protein ENJ18_13410 [Nannocystis exedens]|nr:hypothetical protein [Nannocystis exedens]